ncbi:MAG: carboxymuconolactone decarboxylase family protein [Dehalococcoidia bacterium]
MTRVELCAILVRDGTIFLVRAPGQDHWGLPGGALPEGRDDIPREMRFILEDYGIAAPSIEEDFVDTHYTRTAGGPGVLNLYAPSGWTGDPAAPGGAESGWFSLEEMAALAMNEQVRSAVLQAFGLEVAADPAQEAVSTVLRFPTERAAARDLDEEDSPADALDVLGTLSGRPGPEALAGLRQAYGEIANDVLDAIDRAWTGPALERKTRSLLVVAMTAAMGGRPRALRSHIEGALNHGASREELVEAMRMVATYAGFPAAIEVWPVLEEALERRGMGRPE